MNFERLEHWKDNVLRKGFKDAKDLISEAQTLSEILNEQNSSRYAPLKYGFGINESKSYLEELGIGILNYSIVDKDSESWFGNSMYKQFGSTILPNTLQYQIDGDKNLVKVLKLIGTSYSKSNEFHAEFKNFSIIACCMLFRKAFKTKVPEHVVSKIMYFEEFETIILGKIVKFEKESWSAIGGGGYYFYFTICNNN